MTEAVFFYTFAAVMFSAALAVVLNRQPMYSVLSLLVVMFCLAAFFVMLGAYFLAAVQVLLYAGAVLVLFLFVIMLLNLQPEAIARMRIFTLRAAGTLAALVLFALLFQTLLAQPDERPLYAVPAADGTVESIGRLLFTAYLLPFELASFLILAAIIGAVTLARQQSSDQ
jgi:NADH-quinone oxidoreductase subunit J